MTLLGPALMALAILIVTSLVVMLLWDLAVTRDPEMAIARMSRRAVGLLTGAASTVAAAAMVGVDVALQAPEAVITLLGIGSIMAGVSWPMFGATAFLVYIVAETANGGPPA
jgi:hypothetical protein